jgi:hypothetical protein
MKHHLKAIQPYLIHTIEGVKTFDVRKNDRDFQVGDTITYLPLENDNYNYSEFACPLPEYLINYVLSDFPGIQHGYVVLAISPIAMG